MIGIGTGPLKCRTFQSSTKKETVNHKKNAPTAPRLTACRRRVESGHKPGDPIVEQVHAGSIHTVSRRMDRGVSQAWMPPTQLTPAARATFMTIARALLCKSFSPWPGREMCLCRNGVVDRRGGVKGGAVNPDTVLHIHDGTLGQQSPRSGRVVNSERETFLVSRHPPRQLRP